MRALAARAIADNPNNFKALFGAGVACRLAGDYLSSERHFLDAHQIQPDNHFLLYELGTVQEYLGKFDHAIAHYRNSLNIDPSYYKARLALVMLEKQTVESNMISEMERQFEGRDEDGWRTLHLGHALSKTWEDLGDHAKSFDWLVRGKKRRRDIRPYREAAQVAISEAAPRAWNAMSARPGNLSSEPIFIVGMPRSGTTLVDRILSSHPDVSSAGELPTFPQLFKLLSRYRANSGMDAETLSAAGNIDPEQLGRLYIQSTRPITGRTKRFTDKAPSNYLMAGAILRALPNARVICMRRHPLDTLIGNFKQILPIEDPYYDYVFDIRTTARKIVQFDRTIKTWANVLPPDRFLELSYEALVDNQEAETRRLLAFCNLAWDDRCLNFHENASGVGTPSARQVRSAIFRTAVGRWERYGDVLNPAKAIFAEAGLI